MALVDRDRLSDHGRCIHGRDVHDCAECQAARIRKRKQIEHEKSVARQREKLIVPRWKRQ